MELTTRELHKKREKMWFANMQNHSRYLDPGTGLFAEKYTETRACPVCKLANDRPLFKKSGGLYVACNDCEMIYLNPVLKDEWIEDYYRNNNEFQGEIVDSDTEFYTKLYTKGLNLVAKKFTSPGTILDVGCSAGAFLDIAKENCWKSYGLELNAREAVTSRRKGHIVYEDVISRVRLNEMFDAITLWDVFEHIKDGVKFLEDAKKFLKKDGVVFLQSPSRDSLAARILHSKCNMFDGLEHVNLYGHRSLLRIAEVTGFEVLEYETVISEIGVINNYLCFEHPYLGSTENQDHILGCLNEAWIHENRIGYKFQACLRRK